MPIIDIELPEVPDDAPRVATAIAGTSTPPPAAPATVAPAVSRWPRFVAGLHRPLGREWGIALAVAWVVVMAVGIAVEPAPANPDAAVPLAIDLLSLVQMGLWITMIVGIVHRQRLTAVASLAGAGVLGVMAIGCPASGHHAVGAWWGVQMVGVAALVALSGKALRSSRS